MIERTLAAVIKRAEELGVELEGRVWVKARGRDQTKAGVIARKSYDVHSGRPKLGTLTHDQMMRADVDSLFRLHRVIWLTVAAPWPEAITWPEWSGPLFAIRWALGSLMDAAIDTIRLAERASSEDEALQTLSYRTITSKEEQGKLRDRALKEFERTGSATDKARSEFSISGATASCASNVVFDFYKRWDADEIGYPSWKGPNSIIFIRGDSFGLEKETYLDKDGLESTRLLSWFKVVAGKNSEGEKQETTHKCIVRARGDSDRTTIQRILKGEYKAGDAKLKWDEKKKRWEIALSYSKPREAPKASGTGYLAVRRSVQDMLFVMNNKGETFRECQFIGLKIIDLRKQFTRRKSEAKRGLNLQGKAAKEHGRKRYYRRYTIAQNKEAQAIDSCLKQLASWIRKAAEASGAKLVFLEDFSLAWTPSGGDDQSFLRLLKRMPWAKAEDILRHELEEHGIRIQKMAQAHNFSECPACGGEAKVVDDSVDCQNNDCKLLCRRSMVAAWNMLKAAGVSTDEMTDLKRKVSYLTRALRRRDILGAQRALDELTKGDEGPNNLDPDPNSHQDGPHASA